MPAFALTSVNVPSPLLRYRMFFTAIKPRRPTRDLNAFVRAACGFGQWRCLDVEVDVVGDEEVEVAVAVVVEEGAAGVPAGGGLREPDLAVMSVKVPLPLLR